MPLSKKWGKKSEKHMEDMEKFLDKITSVFIKQIQTWLSLLKDNLSVFCPSKSCSLMIQVFKTHYDIFFRLGTMCLIILHKNRKRKYFEGLKKIREYMCSSLFSLRLTYTLCTARHCRYQIHVVPASFYFTN